MVDLVHDEERAVPGDLGEVERGCGGSAAGRCDQTSEGLRSSHSYFDAYAFCRTLLP
jgi:hypothetical protein